MTLHHYRTKGQHRPINLRILATDNAALLTRHVVWRAGDT